MPLGVKFVCGGNHL